jgi:hypothetical protein
VKHVVVAIVAAGAIAAGAGALATVTSGVVGPARADSWETTPPTTPFTGTASPASSDSAQALVTQLQSSGHKVILNKVGAAPLDQCKVTGVTPGQQIVAPVTSGAKGLSWVVQFTTVYVNADCTTPATPEPAKPAG